MAVVDGDLFVHADDDTEWDAGAWTAADLPVDEVPVALGYGPGVSVAVTDAGTPSVSTPVTAGGTRSLAWGVAGVALAVVE